MTVMMDDIIAARRLIAPYIRVTPLLRLDLPVTDKATVPALTLKLESMQISGSFKARGALNKLLTTPKDKTRNGVVTASGGNHGAAVALVARLLGIPASVFLPEAASSEKEARIRALGAETRRFGKTWEEANNEAQAVARRQEQVYVHPYDDPLIVAGQGTVALDLLDQLDDFDTILIAIGGGGLIGGVGTVLKSLPRRRKIIGIEPEGAPTLHGSLKAGRIVPVENLNTAATTMAARMTAPLNFEIAQRVVDDVILVTDQQLRTAALHLWREAGIAAELTAAAGLALLQSGRYRPEPGEKICALVCGSGTDGLSALSAG